MLSRVMHALPRLGRRRPSVKPPAELWERELRPEVLRELAATLFGVPRETF